MALCLLPLQVPQLAMSYRGHSNQESSGLKEANWSRAMTNQSYSEWKMSVKATVSEVESQYDLSGGEIFLATNTTDSDLRELYSYGWSPQETAMAVVEAVGLR